MTPSESVAFLRGINVGGHRVKMERLRQLLSQLGLDRVRTFIASGNVVFDSADEASQLEVRIQDHLRRELGYSVDTFVRPADHVEEIARLDPFANYGPREGDRVYVIFLRKPPSDDAQGRLSELETEGDRFSALGREVFWLRRGPPSPSSITDFDLVHEALRATNTTRNMNTLKRLAEKLLR